MGTTTRLTLPYPEETMTNDVPRDIRALANALDNAAIDGQGLASARPAAGIAGRYYWATDTKTLSRDDGTGWTIIYQGWTSWVPTVATNYQGSTSGSGPTLGSYTARVKIQSGLCFAFFVGAVSLASGSGPGPAYNISLPVTALYGGVPGTATVQNGVGQAITGGETVANTPNNSYVQMLNYNHTNLVADNAPRTDSYFIVYEI